MNLDIERAQIACVFGLGGGELHEPDERFPDEWDGLIAYWYEGVPDYATELRHQDEARTALLYCLFGFPEAPVSWTQVASFSSSCERECLWCGPGTDWDGTVEQEGAREADPITATGYRGRPECPLCEGDGYVYLCEGWCEVVCVPSRATTA